MEDPDFNLLRALEAFLAEGSVTGAARRLGLSDSAASRTLARLREVTGDPLLVRAGRGLVPTPRAQALRARLLPLIAEIRDVLGPGDMPPDPAALDREFTIRANEGFVSRFAAPLIAAIGAVAPRVRLRFVPKPRKEAAPLRDGSVDLEIGVLGDFAPEIRVRTLFHDQFIGVVRVGHPLLEAPVTAARYAACRHVVASRRGRAHGPVDAALEAQGLARDIAALVPGFPEALSVAARSDLVALVPRSCLEPGAARGAGLAGFELPVTVPGIVISAMWHPRMQADAVHLWFREQVIACIRREGVSG